MAIKWHFYDDFRDLVMGGIGPHRIPRPKGRELALFIGGKATFFTIAFGIPLLVHAWWVVALYYVLLTFVLGMVLSVVFQLAHCVEEASFPLPSERSGKMEGPWAVHQVQTTVDFCQRNFIASWLLGGLNYQIEQHPRDARRRRALPRRDLRKDPAPRQARLRHPLPRAPFLLVGPALPPALAAPAGRSRNDRLKRPAKLW